MGAKFAPPPFFFYFYFSFLLIFFNRPLGFWNPKREVGKVAKSVRALRSRVARSGAVANREIARGRGYLSPAVFQSLSLRSSVGTFTTTL